jgi:transcriptional regulator with XRE-family HTH domain
VNVVRQLRLKAGLTQSLLAGLVGTDAATISRYENGHRSPTLTMLDRLAESVGLEVVVSFEAPEASGQAVAGTKVEPPPRFPLGRSPQPPQDMWTL